MKSLLFALTLLSTSTLASYDGYVDYDPYHTGYDLVIECNSNYLGELNFDLRQNTYVDHYSSEERDTTDVHAASINQKDVGNSFEFNVSVDSKLLEQEDKHISYLNIEANNSDKTITLDLNLAQLYIDSDRSGKYVGKLETETLGKKTSEKISCEVSFSEF